MIYISLLAIIILFFVIALIVNPIANKTLRLKICAICAASSITWISLFFLDRIGLIDIDSTFLGVMMGGSVVGIMYALEKYFKRNSIQKFWIVRVLLIPIGFLAAYSLAIWDVFMIKISLGLVFFLIIILFFLLSMNKKDKHNKEKANKVKEGNELSDKDKEEAIKKLEKSLEDCC